MSQPESGNQAWLLFVLDSVLEHGEEEEAVTFYSSLWRLHWLRQQSGDEAESHKAIVNLFRLDKFLCHITTRAHIAYTGKILSIMQTETWGRLYVKNEID